MSANTTREYDEQYPSDEEHHEEQVGYLLKLARKAFGDDTAISGDVIGEDQVLSIQIYNGLSRRWVEIYGGSYDECVEWLKDGGM